MGKVIAMFIPHPSESGGNARSGIAERQRIVRDLHRAAAVLARDPAAADLLLDGMISRVIAAWYLQRHLSVPTPEDMLDDLRCRAPQLASRVRLALLSSGSIARLRQCQLLIEACTAPTTQPATCSEPRPSSHSARGPESSLN